MAAPQETFEEGTVPVASAKLRATLQDLENVRLDIAVTGGSGSGKSTFVNVIRGLGDEDQGSAKTGVVEIIADPTPYPHPKFPNVIIWDMPGVETPLMEANKYLDKLLPSRYDFFLIMVSERFTTSHAQLACAIQDQGKPFYFIRSKVDIDMAASRQRRPTTFSEEGVLCEIRAKCCTELEDEGVMDPEVFLLSMFELGKYDFQLLIEIIEKDMDSQKHHAFLVALPNVSQAILEKKKDTLKQHIWLVATVACSSNPQPVPGVKGVTCDLSQLMRSLDTYRRSFGLDSTSLCKLAQQTGQPLRVMQSAILGPSTEVTEAQVIELLAEATHGPTGVFAKELSSVPVLGVVASCGYSFAVVYQMLRTYLTGAAKNAQRVIKRAFHSSL
ncbi:interferon-inducible GTPase 5-like [Gracilinanus agilis]|uniref:interferon-inducible GTPase 5-like n=1 Tax=Gracilinanus agilis TaxID=191870 RepID=UPI001CFDE5F4|nr:interferon-inducible GTPase 5-like [Gracilinanus agilis]